MDKDNLHAVCLGLVDSGFGFQAIELISQMLAGRQIQENHKYREAVNSLVTIKKINKGRNKAIDALCELD